VGTTSNFLKQDGANQATFNMRNKIMKFGAPLTLKQGDLALGYVTGISKAGCFIQVGYNTSIRAGLNELFDEPDVDFVNQLPIGVVVLARITKTEDNNTKFNCSLRRSLLLYGVHHVKKNEIKPGMRYSCVVLATSADGVSFAQIKGSYYKLKVKDTPPEITRSAIISVQISKVTPEKITGDFIGVDQTLEEEDQESRKAEEHIQSVMEKI
jgi:hypothetical protein